ncbi:hybrid sensor histidine kinase/response regulator [endosymbiont of Riftia pachyptila]|nr:PAS domain-containing sensor histidine kinase [endosymbiont of Riftia pachyptila]
MSNDDFKNTNNKQLLERLERLQSTLLPSGEKQNLSQLLHDLQVHQIELELQNRTLQSAQVELEESRDRYAALYDFAPVGYLSLDAQGIIRQINLTGARLLNRERGRLLQTPFSRYLAPMESEIFFGHLRAVFHSRGTQNQLLSITQPEGEQRQLRMESLVSSGEGEQQECRSVLFDITEEIRAREEKARLQRELQQAQKMESIGLLTGGIAHDFNNLLAIIRGHTQLIQERLGIDPPERQGERLEQVLEASGRARDLIADLLNFSQRREAPPTTLAPARKIADMLPLLRATFPSSIELQTRLRSDTPAIQIAPVAFDQLLMNLCLNARDAMEGQGRLLIELCRQQLSDSECDACHQPFTGEWVEISISDTGSGIPMSDRHRLFDPFFTTKPPGQGTGLGLSMVYSILKQHGGHVLLESRPGRGSRFRLLFPPVEATLGSTPETTGTISSTPPPPAGGQQIIVLDDEPAIARLLGELLTASGYQVSVHTDAPALLRDLESGKYAPDLLITDQTMPGLTGVELIQHLRPDYAKLPIILCSGYSEVVNAANANAFGADRFLEKPVDAANLRALVQELLEASGTARSHGKTHPFEREGRSQTRQRSR